jgi:hypothetical protein
LIQPLLICNLEAFSQPCHPSQCSREGSRKAASFAERSGAGSYELSCGLCAFGAVIGPESVVNKVKYRSYTHLVITAHQHDALKTSIRSNSDFWKCLRSSATFDSPNVCKNDVFTSFTNRPCWVGRREGASWLDRANSECSAGRNFWNVERKENSMEFGVHLPLLTFRLSLFSTA